MKEESKSALAFVRSVKPLLTGLGCVTDLPSWSCAHDEEVKLFCLRHFHLRCAEKWVVS